jgi:hypothetical protein
VLKDHTFRHHLKNPFFACHKTFTIYWNDRKIRFLNSIFSHKMAEDNTINNMAKNRNQPENHLAIGHSIGSDVDIGNDNHASSYTDDPRNNQCNKPVNSDVVAHNNARTDIGYTENAAFSQLWPNLAAEMESNNNRLAIAEQGNLMSMTHSVRNLGFVPNMNMNFNHQQINALNASLNAAGTINNVGFPRLRNPMLVPDVNATLSNTTGFQNSHHHAGFSAEFIPGTQNHNHMNPFAVTEDSHIAAMHRGVPSGERCYGGQSGLTQGSMGDSSSMLRGRAGNSGNNKAGSKRRGTDGRGVANLSIAKRVRHSEQPETLAQEQHQPPSAASVSGQWGNTSTGRSYPLFVEGDERNLSQYQCLARKQMEVFEATAEDAGNNAQGRNRPILPGQIGIRCRHCYKLPPKERKTGSVYFPNRVRIGVIVWLCTVELGHWSGIDA